MSRVRRVESREEMERSIDEFVTRGYELESTGERTARLKERDNGDPTTHLILLALSGWWTFGLSNALYALYSRVNAEKVLIKLEDVPDDDE